MNTPYYNEPMSYCKKHKQKYLATIPVCPICRGEEMGKTMNGKSFSLTDYKKDDMVIKKPIEKPKSKKKKSAADIFF